MGKLRKADLGVAAYVLAAFIMLIVSVPAGLLDVLLACILRWHLRFYLAVCLPMKC